ncbi:hypothetical protein AX16_002616 [Volvariella volvacea WC 439]|nr:hypothetical protein AX16_002616 [Volvariella volvacea WC 439]
MSIDPYHAVQNDIQTSLQAATQLRASYLRIRGMARDDSEELIWARNELKATLATLEADLEDLEESVKVVESADARLFGLDYAEVQERRRYVSHVRREIESMRQELDNESRTGPGPSSSPYTPSTPRPVNNTHLSDPGQDDDHQAAWARQEQQMLIHEQDRTIDSIAGTLHTLAQQASLMGQEIEEHHEYVISSPPSPIPIITLTTFLPSRVTSPTT